MKIKHITISNFKSIEHLDFEFNDIIVALIAQNGKGKTSFKEAFYAGITGEFPENCIRNGQNSCSVKITLEDGTIFERIQNRNKPNKVLVENKATTVRTLNELITAKTSLSKDVLKIVLSTDILQNLQPGEFGKFITTYIPENMDYETVVSYMPFATKESKQVLQKLLPPMPQTFGIQKLNEVYNVLVENRKETKKELAILEARIQSFDGTEPTKTLAQIEEQLNETLRKDGAQKSAKVAINMYNAAVNNKKQAIFNLNELKKKVNSIVATKPSPEVIENIRTERNRIHKTIINIKTTINTIRENISVFQNTINNLNKPICPISEKLVCTTDKTHIKEELQALIQSNKESLQTQQNMATEYEKKLKELEIAENNYRINEALYKEKVILANRYEEQKKNLPIIPEKPEVVKILDYAPMISELKKQRDHAFAYNQYLKDQKNRNDVYNKLLVYEELCNIFNAKGEVMHKITEHYLFVFDSTCNAIAQELNKGIAFKFVAENGISYLVRPENGKEFTKFSSLSSGEQLLALFVLIGMLNRLTGSRIMLLDDLDKLDANAFDSLLTLIQDSTIQSSFDHIIISAVNHKDIMEIVNKHRIRNIY